MEINVNHRGEHGWCATAKDDTGMVDSTSGHATEEAALLRLYSKISDRISKAKQELRWYFEAEELLMCTIAERTKSQQIAYSEVESVVQVLRKELSQKEGE